MEFTGRACLSREEKAGAPDTPGELYPNVLFIVRKKLNVEITLEKLGSWTVE